jgi:small-conductance mechanosensitive channel
MIIVPNAEMVNSKIINFSMHDRRAPVNSTLKFPLEVPFSEVDRICREIIGHLPRVSAHPTLGVGLTSLAEGCQVVEVSFWVGDYADVSEARTHFNRELLAAIHAKGYSFWVTPVQVVKG